MKKLVFVCYNLKIGGVQKSLINLLNNLSNKYTIDLYLFDVNGELINQLSTKINIMKPFNKLRHCGISQKESLRNGVINYLLRGLFAVKCRLFGSKKIISKLIKKINVRDNYDASISFFQNVSETSVMWGCNALALRYPSKKHIAFVHGDFEQAHLNIDDNIKEYDSFDYVCGVSDTGVSQIKKYVKKTEVVCVRNTHNIETINQLSYEPVNFARTDSCVFVTVCRLSEEKGVDRIIEVCEKLENENLKYKWIVVGSSNNFEYYKNLALSKNIKNLIFEGEQKNPYKYIRFADFLVVSSYHEAAPMVIDEANIIGTQVITTNFSAALELCKNNIVCDNTTNALYIEIKKNILSFSNHLTKKTKYTQKDNNDRIKVFTDLL